MKTYDTSMLSEQQVGGLSLDEEIKRGIEASEAGDKAGAEQIFRQVVAEHPDSLEAWIWLGWTSLTLDSSEAAFTRAAALAPSNEEAQLGLRWVASQRAPEQQAMPERAMPTVPERYQVETAASATVARQSGPLDALTLSQPTEAYGVSEASVPSEAPVEIHQQRVLPEGWNFDDVMRQAVKLAQMGDKPAAYAIFHQVAERYPNRPTVWVWCGGTSPTLDDAEYAFGRARQLDPTNEEANLGLRWVALRRRVIESGRLTPTYPSSTSTNNLTGHALPPIPHHTGELQAPKVHGDTVETAEVVAPDKKLNFFMRLLKKLNIPLPVILLIVAIVVVYAVVAMVYLSGPAR